MACADARAFKSASYRPTEKRARRPHCAARRTPFPDRRQIVRNQLVGDDDGPRPLLDHAETLGHVLEGNEGDGRAAEFPKPLHPKILQTAENALRIEPILPHIVKLSEIGGHHGRRPDVARIDPLVGKHARIAQDGLRQGRLLLHVGRQGIRLDRLEHMKHAFPQGAPPFPVAAPAHCTTLSMPASARYTTGKSTSTPASTRLVATTRHALPPSSRRRTSLARARDARDA